MLIQDSNGFLFMTTLFPVEHIFNPHKYISFAFRRSSSILISSGVSLSRISAQQLGLSLPAQLALLDMWQQWTDEQSPFLDLVDEDSGFDTCHVCCIWLNGGAFELWTPIELALHHLRCCIDILVNEAAHLFISVDIQLGCILDPEDSVSIRGSSCFKLDSDGIVNQLSKGMSCAFQKDLKVFRRYWKCLAAVTGFCLNQLLFSSKDIVLI